jgi:hypothetical protein
MEGPQADSEEKREPVSDIDIAVVDSLKVLDPNRPIREADIGAIQRTRGKIRIDRSAVQDRSRHSRAARDFDVELHCC